MSDNNQQQQPNPDVPSLWGSTEGSSRVGRKKKVLESHPVGKQWANVSTKVKTDNLVPLPDDSSNITKPKIMANLPGVNYKNLPPTMVEGNDGQKEKEEAIKAADLKKQSKAGAISGDNTSGGGGGTPSLFAGSDAYFNKAITKGGK